MRSEVVNGIEYFFDPIAFSVQEAAMIANSSRTELYKALRQRALKGKKQGRRTVILREHLREYLLSLPDYQSAVSGE